MIKALFFDIDGTLVSFNTHLIPQSTVDAITAAKAKGIEIYISTGRPYRLVNNIGQIEHLIDGFITANGAYCFIGTDVVACKPIPRADVSAIIAESRTSGFPCMVVGVDKLTMFNAESRPDEVRHVCRMLNLDVVADLPVEEVTAGPVIQLTPFIPEADEPRILGPLSGIEYSRWFPTFTDVTAKGVSKAEGIAAIAARRGFGIADTMAFGDGGNDLSMVKAAGIGVAMGNANPVLKEAADYVTTTVDNNGILNALTHFGII